MTVTLTFPPETGEALRAKATRAGQSVEGYIRGIVEQAVSAKTFDEILAPVREGFAASGLSEEELARLFEEARDEVWQERGRKDGVS